MNVLFVSSGNSRNGISPIVKNQGESLRKNGVEIDYFTIKGKGFRGYLNNIKPLKKYLKSNQFDVVHTHYSLSSFVASLAGARPMFVSLMGSDVKSSKTFIFIIRLFKWIFRWKRLIVKSDDMRKSLGIKDVVVISNGVDLSLFEPKDKLLCQKQLGWNTNKKNIIFAANPARPEKNFKLSKNALDILNNEDIELHVLENVQHELVPVYMNASDVVLLSSLWEGSPNVIKEAMACNRPIVSTDVGDVQWIMGGTDGCYITSNDPLDVAQKIELALQFSQTNGRVKLQTIGLDSTSIARRIIEIYQRYN